MIQKSSASFQCRTCGELFCADCLIHALGRKQPPFCMQCALVAGGIRRAPKGLKKQKRGLYVIAYFTALGSAIVPMERDVNLSEDVLRVLVTDADHLNQEEMEKVEPQPIQPREERSWDRPPMGMGEDFGGPPRRPARKVCRCRIPPGACCR